MYVSVESDIADYITATTADGVDKMANPIPNTNVFIGQKVAFNNQMKGDYQVIVKATTGDKNPKWARDKWWLVIQAIGRDGKSYRVCEETLHRIAQDLNGRDSLEIGDRVYFNFQLPVAPIFVRSTELSEPLFTSTISFNVDYKNDDGNRTAIP